MKKKVHLETIIKLFKLFTDKKWTEIDLYEDVLKRFGNLIEALNEEESELLLELIDRYIWLSYNDYQKILRQLFISLYDSRLNDVNKLYIFPIRKENDEGQTKSGDIVNYMLKGILALLDRYNEIEITPLSKFEEINEDNFKLKENEYIVFVDDYVGSGLTLDSTLKAATENKTIGNKFSILTTIIQENTSKILLDKNINVLFGETLKKGISEFYEDEDLYEKKRIMQKIEDRIAGVKNYRFGFEASEALATLIRTPNNTFPIFWKEYTHKKEKLKAPFSRY